MNRREFQLTLAAWATAWAFPADQAGASELEKPTGSASTAAKYQIAMLVYPKMTALDLIGPQYAFASIMGANVSLVAKTLEPVVSDTGVKIIPDLSFQSCPRDLDVLFIPGGSYGTVAMMEDPDVIGFVRDRGARARWITSVCTGSLVLGAAGLLQGRRATSHWLVRDKILPILGAKAVNARVVQDGNIVTGAGVSAGLDLGLNMVNLIMGAEYAQAVQLMEEYAPHPPFNAGSPESAGAKITGMMTEMHQEFLTKTRASAWEAHKRLTV